MPGLKNSPTAEREEEGAGRRRDPPCNPPGDVRTNILLIPGRLRWNVAKGAVNPYAGIMFWPGSSLFILEINAQESTTINEATEQKDF